MTTVPLTFDEPSALDEQPWPPSTAFLDLSHANLITAGQAHPLNVAMCDDAGLPTDSFYQGAAAHFYYEFEISEPIGVPIGGIEIHDAMGRLIHGKNTAQYGTAAPQAAPAGARLRFHHVVRLDLGSGEYRLSVALATTSAEFDARYRAGTIADEAFRHTIQELCRVIRVGSFRVELDPARRLLHHGLANLPGYCHVSTTMPPAPAPSPGVLTAARHWAAERIASFAPFAGRKTEASERETSSAPADTPGQDDTCPTVFHITHWKAGSQWINKILKSCVPERIVAPQASEGQFLHWPLLPGKIYPTVYVTSQQFASVRLPANWRRFVVIRDLRDTLISAYFSLKTSHPDEAHNAVLRERLQSLNIEEGLGMLMDEWLPGSARIQLSWLEAGERLIRYEDLLERDLEILEQVLLEECKLPVDQARFREVIVANRFEQLTQGRARGQEDAAAHERKGISGDWRNYFSAEIKRKFKNRYGGVLIATGYERDFDW